MAERDSTTIKDEETLIRMEALAAMNNVMTTLDGLAAIAVLKIQAASEREGSDIPPPFWRDLYKDTPWVAAHEEPPGDLPVGLEQGLSRLIFKQVAQAWEELSEKVGRLFGREDHRLLAEGGSKEEGEGAGEPSRQEVPASPEQGQGILTASLMLIEATRNNIEARADRLINQDAEAPLDAGGVAKIAQEIKVWAAGITKDMAK